MKETNDHANFRIILPGALKKTSVTTLLGRGILFFWQTCSFGRFSKLRCLFWCPYNEDFDMLGSLLGSTISGN